ncbi:hypothetical protein HMI56_003905 [Coelomomyces lativittatus]|nr:hypothetical protein HMI56_003905 [Coelomomyces lativittatus]
MTTPLLLQLQKLKDQFHQATSAGFTPNPTLLGNHPNSSTLLNPTQCAQLLTQAKILLTTHPLASHFLLPHGDVKALTSDELQILMLTRDLLEMGTFYAIHLKDVHLFEQYYHQVSIYYAWPLPGSSSSSSSSSKHAQVVGFYLLHLLAQNRMAEFHATLETVSHLDHMYIQQAMHLEQAIMEGTYQRVWQVHQNLSNSLETQWFMELLMETIRYT